MRKIDEILNSFTMYRVVLYSLLFLSGIAFALSFSGLVPFNPLNLAISFFFIPAVCYTTNLFFSKILKVPTNLESWAITSLILFFILTPVKDVNDVIFVGTAGVLAMGSKYIIAPFKRHVFNPAVFGLVVIGILGASQAEWWVGNTYLFPFTLICGLLIVRKVRKFQLFSSYVLFALTTIGFFAFKNGLPVPSTILQAITSWPFLFLGTVMLTEPITMPPTKNKQLIYASIVGFFSGAQFHVGPIFSTSELALFIGNIYSYLVGFKYRFGLTFKEKIKISPNIYEFIFSKNKNLKFAPGQYLEWTLSHKNPDSRGVRRYFTIASSPTEQDLRLGVKIDENSSSSFKKALLALAPGKKIYAGELSGDFVLPDSKNEKYVFIAGGIGITPFRSIIKSLIDKKENKDIVLFYACSTESEFAFQNIFNSAKEFGVKTVYVCSNPSKSWKGVGGRLTEQIIKNEVPDFKNRTYYLSGPISLVNAYKKSLGQIGIKPNKIVTDYFPGY